MSCNGACYCRGPLSRRGLDCWALHPFAPSAPVFSAAGTLRLIATAERQVALGGALTRGGSGRIRRHRQIEVRVGQRVDARRAQFSKRALARRTHRQGGLSRAIQAWPGSDVGNSPDRRRCDHFMPGHSIHMHFQTCIFRPLHDNCARFILKSAQSTIKVSHCRCCQACDIYARKRPVRGRLR